MGTLSQDVRYSLRVLGHSPGFAAVAILTLALAIGANTAIFSVVNTVLLAPLPYRDSDRLVMVWGKNLAKGFARTPVSGGDFEEWKAQNNVFEEMAPSSDTSYTLTGAGDPQFVVGYDLSAEYFHTLGVAPELGRTFLAEEDKPGGPNNVVVLSNALWRRTFHADREIVGKSITLDGKPFNVVGVMPPNFKYPTLTELWTPLAMPSKYLSDYQLPSFRVLARLKPGVNVTQAQAQMDAIQRGIDERHPDTDNQNEVSVVPLREEIAGDVRKPLLMLLGAVGFVLLIACANVANLMLARATGRRKEIAVRRTLGASDTRLVRQLLTESLMLSLAGGAIGLLFAVWATGFLVSIFPNNIANLSIPIVTLIPLDLRVFAFTLLVALVTGALFGLAPALQLVRRDFTEGLRESSRSATSASPTRRLRSVLVVSEVSLALVLLVGAGLFIESFRNLQRGNLGFDADRVVSAQVFLAREEYPSTDPLKRLAFVSAVLEKLRAIPGVESAGATNFLPLSGFEGDASLTVKGRPQPPPGQEASSDSELITPDYFRTMGIRVLKGRNFSESDRKGAPQVAIVNETLAHQLWGNEDPLGQQLNVGEGKETSLWEVVGVVSDVKSFGLEQKQHADLYRPFAQIPFPLVAFVVRSPKVSAALSTGMQQAIWAVDGSQPIFKLIGLQQLADESFGLRRVSTVLLGAFSGVALVLAGLGIYGVMAFSVAQRTHEIGVRMALGAQPVGVLQMVLREGMSIALAGVAIGVAGALATARVVASLLYGVKATDPRTFILTSATLAGIALIACLIPARRATRVDPIVALRHE